MRTAAQRGTRRDTWTALRLDLESQVRESSSGQYPPLTAANPALAGYRTASGLLEALSVTAPDPAAKDRIYAALVEAARARAPTSTLARALLWLGLWPGLEAVLRRVRRILPDRAEATALVAHTFLEEIAGIDLDRCRRVAATLVRNTERKVTERLRVERRAARCLDVPLPEIPVAPAAPSELGLPPGLPDDDQVDFIRHSLNELVGAADARLIVGASVLGRNLRELGVELDVSHEAVRKRLQRALRLVRQRFAHDDTASPRALATRPPPREESSVNRSSSRPSSSPEPLLAKHQEASMTNAASAAVRFSPSTVTRQPDRAAHKFILTGRSGIGKTFFASTVPGVFIIPVEEGLKGASPDHEPAHFSVVPRSLRELHQALDAFVEMNAPAADKKRPYTHLAIDSLSGVEALVHEAAQELEHARHMDAKEYKVVWSAAASFWGELQRKLDAIRRLGVHVWLIAHAAETVEATASGETFRKWDLAFKGSGASLAEVRQFWRAWADHVFFLDWVAKVVPGSKGKRSVGKYEGRVLHTRESPTYYAKTRARLPGSIPAHWDDVARAMAAGAAAPEAKLRAQLADLLPQLEPADRAAVEAELAAARGANRIAAIVSRAQGMLALAHEEVTEVASEADDEAPDTSPAGPAQEGPVEEPAPAELVAVEADDAMAPTDPAPPTIDPAFLALAEDLERQIDAKVGAELEAMPELVKTAKLPAPLEARVRARYVARVKALRSAATNGGRPSEARA